MTPDLRNGHRVKLNGSPDRLPPSAVEAERGVLGCILLDSSIALPACEERLSAESFYDLRNRTIYQCAVSMAARGEAIDELTLANRLAGGGQLETVGGGVYLSELSDCTPSAHNAERYADILREKYVLRRVIRCCADAVALAYERGNDPYEVLDSLERDVMAIAQTKVKSAEGMRSLVLDAMSAIEDRQVGGMLTGLSTGFIDFDKLTGGLQAGEMIVLAARPAVGKTSLALNVADALAVGGNVPVGVMSLEMTAKALTARLITARARVSLRNINDGFLADRDVPKLIAAAAKLRTAPIYIDDSSEMTILQLKAKVRRMRQQRGIKLLIVDYVQLVTSSGRRVENRQQEVADVSKGLKALAKDLDIPVLVLSQLNRLLDRERRRPVLADLKESGSIEQDADVVAFLHRARKGEDGESDHDGQAVDLIIAKQRNGPADVTVHLTFLKPYTRFESAAKISDEEAEQPKERHTQWTDKL